MNFSEPQKYILTSQTEINLFLAGVGSGKTHLAGALSGYLISKCPNVFGFIGANTYNQLNTSTMLRVREVWKDFFKWRHGEDYVVGIRPPAGFKTDAHNFERYDGIVSFKNGGVIFIGSLDNAKAHDGKQFGWAMLDETKDTKEADVKETIITRIRQQGMYIDAKGRVNMEGGRSFNPLYIFTSPAKVQWLNEMFKLPEMRGDIESRIYSETDFFAYSDKLRSVCVSSTYHNQKNLPKGYIDRIISTNNKDRANVLIYGNPFTKTGGEFYSGFNAVFNVGKSVYLPQLPLHITFDQNVVPYITALIWQVQGNNLVQIDEFNLPNPNNTTERLCEAIKARYNGHTAGAFIYGDASGNSRSTKSNETDYIIAKRVLRPFLSNNSDRTTRKNPPVLKRGEFINNLLEGKVGEWRVIIGDKNKGSIADLTYLKQDQNGAKLKERVKDETTGTTYEKYGHNSDAMDYFLCKVLESEFNRFLLQR